MIGPIQFAFEDYMAKCYPELPLDSMQYRELQRTFFAGARLMTIAVLEVAAEKAAAYLMVVDQELSAIAKQLTADPQSWPPVVKPPGRVS